MSKLIDTSGQNNIAVLFDADNVSKDYVKTILDACAGYGRVIIKRAYGNWTDSRLQGWGPVFREFAIKPVQQFMYTKGKNITDSAMTIDAMDILHAKDIDIFVLASSDSDFTGLATRIREDGLEVIGVGRGSTSPAFINACDEFLILENLVEEETLEEEVREEPVYQTEVQEEPMPQAEDSEVPLEVKGRELLIRAVKTTQDENGLVKGAVLGVALRRIDPAFTPKTYGVSKLYDFIKKYPDVLEVEGRRTATDPTYKSKL